MNEKHHHNLKMYVNDVIALEREMINAVEGQLKDERVSANTRLAPVLRAVITGARARLQRLKNVSEAEGGSLGASMKEAASSVAGAVEGIYDKLRSHAVSRIVRDDLVGLDVFSTSYTMLYTLGLATGHSEVAEIARSGMTATAPLVMELTQLLPGIVLGELADEAPLANPAVESVVLAAIHEVWSQDPNHLAGVH